ncbi:MAG TPA: hypothetical protein VK509_08095 [Polyangiales bacterium]|nr:hypothetical protein [Polyangiales bacterium]
MVRGNALHPRIAPDSQSRVKRSGVGVRDAHFDTPARDACRQAFRSVLAAIVR